MTMLSRCVLAAVVVSLGLFAVAAEPGAKPEDRPIKPQPKPVIQLALLLDNSGSMQGLIDQARSQLWTVVNHLARTKKNGQTPRLEVALYQYGERPQQLLPFTDDLDAVSEKLFAIGISGGSEHCGEVIQLALNELKWSDEVGVYKTLFIAGNEPFTQGPADYRSACETASARGVIVNTIHCGSEAAGVNGKWDDGARLGGGRYVCIESDKAVIAIAAPQDAEIAELSTKLNGTYVPFGANGAEFSRRQLQQDAAASTAPAAAQAGAPLLRAQSKASSLYRNGSWDLVDAVVNEKTVKLEELKDADLPEVMRGMTPEQRKAHVDAQAKARTGIQDQIKSLSSEREKFIAEKRRESAAGGEKTLDSAILSAVGEQLKAKSYE
ncbi:MAG: hypothetical protein QOE14_1704 [Humisphaera sp.]|nr:hypothetical protein [Humisphaera sp.]